MKIIVTGGLGYLGSIFILYTCFTRKFYNDETLEIIILDIGVNSSKHFKMRQKMLQDAVKVYNSNVTLRFLKCSVCNIKTWKLLEQEDDVDFIYHFAAKKVVSESNEKSNFYYSVNLNSTIHMLNYAKKMGIKNVAFVSSAAIYDESLEKVPEFHKISLKGKNVYAKTKIVCEEIISDFHQSNPDMNIGVFRVFNPCGSWSDEVNGFMMGEILESKNNDKKGSKNVMSKLMFNDRHDYRFFINGNTHPTMDGTPVRDYIHVVDVAHAFYEFLNEPKHGIWNICTGKGTSIHELIKIATNSDKSSETLELLENPRNIVMRKGVSVDKELSYSVGDNSHFRNTYKDWEVSSNVLDMLKDTKRWIVYCEHLCGDHEYF